MSIKKFIATKDNTITNSFKAGLRTRATGSNMGASDILEVFSVYAQASTSSLEKSRILIDFPINSIVDARTNLEIPESGSVSFKLKMFNAEHSQTVPSSFKLSIYPVSSSWSEGHGLDMEGYTDIGFSNWVSSSVSQGWTNPGSDYLTGSFTKEVSFDTGLENIDIDISDIVENWIASSSARHGLLIKMSGSSEDGSEKRSYYTKRFFGRNSEFFLKRPIIEAQYDNSIQDNRANIVRSSSLAPAPENKNTIFFYNRPRGSLVDIPNTGSSLLVRLHNALSANSITASVSGNKVSQNFITASRHSKGIYKAEFEYVDNYDSIYDVWQITSSNSNGYIQIHSGTVMYSNLKNYSYSEPDEYVLNISNLKPKYNKKEKTRFKIYTRKSSWGKNIYTKASTKAPIDNIQNLFYKITRVSDNFEVINYSTSSAVQYSKTSFDASGSYFDLDMSILEPNYLYEISFVCKKDNRYEEQKERFRFRVDP